MLTTFFRLLENEFRPAEVQVRERKQLHVLYDPDLVRARNFGSGSNQFSIVDLRFIVLHTKHLENLCASNI